MGPCCVEGCEVTSEETFYFEFPTSRLLRKKWLELIPIPGKLPIGTVVCSRHFNAEDYESVRGKVRLKSKVVPSLLLEQQVPMEPLSPSEIPLPKSPPPSVNAPSSPKSTKSPVSPKTPVSPSPVKEIEAGDSTTVSVPSPVDAEKMIDDIQKRIAGSINILMKTQNGVIGDDRTVSKSPPTVPIIGPLDQKEDIEDMITNYHIKNTVPNPALLPELMPAPVELAGLKGDEPIEIEDVQEAAPVFIEVSVDKDAGTGGAGSGDCLMVLESVQVDVDPSTLLLAHDDEYYREEERKALLKNKKQDPISLLTSSDEDDVILEEPKIDTVEVSDETDEDDVPLVKLVKTNPGLSKKKLKKKTKTKRPKPNDDKIVWGMYDFYCVPCHFSTQDSTEYDKHISEHSTVLHVCPICSYTSASKSMYSRHTRIHKVEKKFKCHLCDYRARHKMSLIYHIKKHDGDNAKSKDFNCKRCSFVSDNKLKVLEHLSVCRDRDKKHACVKCQYATNKKSDLKRHVERRHPNKNEESNI